MNKRNRGWRAPVAALLALLLYALWLWRCAEPRFALGDDFYLARAFAGEVGGVAESYNVYIHTVFAWLLHGLTLLFPGVWWFSWLQMALLMLGGYGVLLGLTRTAEHSGLPGAAGFGAGLLFLWAYALEFSVTVTYTTTAAVAGAGAVCLLAGTDITASGRRLAAPLLGSAALLWCAGMLRTVAVLPALVFWLGLLAAKVLVSGRFPLFLPHPHDIFISNSRRHSHRQSRLSLRPLLRLLALTAALTGLLMGVRLAERALTPEEDGYQAFFQARIIPTDYGGLNVISSETQETIGWTEKETALARSWYFLDENMSTESFAQIGADAEAQTEAPLLQRVKDGLRLVRRLLDTAPNARGFLLICLGLCAAAFLAACFGGRDSLWRFLAPVGCATVVLFLLFYLGVQGRLPIRAAASVLLPGSAMALALALDGLGRCRGRRLACPPALAAAACCVWIACAIGGTAFAFCHQPDHGDPDQCVYAAVERYAAAHEDTLYIGDRTLGVDRRMFPDRSWGASHNLLPMWGGWNNHSQGYRAAFASHGLSHDGFVITEFLGERVRLIAGEDGISPEFLAYLEEQAGSPVTPVTEYQGNGFTVYAFRRTDGGSAPKTAPESSAAE